MYANDFEYDGEYLSNWGYELCDIDSSNGFETINTDSQRTFDTVSQFNGKHYPLVVSYYYIDTITYTMQEEGDL